MNASPQKVAAVRGGILAWFSANRRDLPWRRTRDPYRILLSEVMLQQTQVDRVIPYFERFLDAFPTVADLASAPTAEVIRLWAGLGYNRRAVNLQRTAQVVVTDHGGVFPNTVAGLLALPGIGPYTAGAIAAFAFEQDAAFVDTNMRRTIHRTFFGAELPGPLASERQILEIAAELVPSGRGWEWNQALIEFGALQCTARKPACVVCPLQVDCAAYPNIQTVLTTPGDRTKCKKDVPFAGSNRYYRGRIVDVLRSSPADSTETGIELEAIGRLIRPDYNAEEHLPWLVGLISDLSRDGLAVIAEERAQYDASAPGDDDGAAATPTLIVRLP